MCVEFWRLVVICTKSVRISEKSVRSPFKSVGITNKMGNLILNKPNKIKKLNH